MLRRHHDRAGEDVLAVVKVDSQKALGSIGRLDRAAKARRTARNDGPEGLRCASTVCQRPRSESRGNLYSRPSRPDRRAPRPPPRTFSTPPSRRTRRRQGGPGVRPARPGRSADPPPPPGGAATARPARRRDCGSPLSVNQHRRLDRGISSHSTSKRSPRRCRRQRSAPAEVALQQIPDLEGPARPASSDSLMTPWPLVSCHARCSSNVAKTCSPTRATGRPSCAASTDRTR